jgi:hypothetical protein
VPPFGLGAAAACSEVTAGRGWSRTGFAPEGLFPLEPPETAGDEEGDGALSGLGWLVVEGSLAEEGALSRLGSLAEEGSLAGEGALAPVGALAGLGAEVCAQSDEWQKMRAAREKRGAKAQSRESFIRNYRPGSDARHGGKP